MSQTKISSYDALSELSALSSTYKKWGPASSVTSRLTTVYLEHTPLYELPDYRERCLALLPSVTQLDISWRTTTRSLHATPTPFVSNKQPQKVLLIAPFASFL